MTRPSDKIVLRRQQMCARTMPPQRASTVSMYVNLSQIMTDHEHLGPTLVTQKYANRCIVKCCPVPLSDLHHRTAPNYWFLWLESAGRFCASSPVGSPCAPLACIRDSSSSCFFC